MSTKAKWANALTGGGTGALDKIDGANLTDLDMAFVATATMLYPYILDADDGGAESSPDKIQPDTNAGTKMWDLLGLTTKNLVLQSVVNAGVDTDKFLVLDASGNVDFRTGAEVLADIVAAASAHTHDDRYYTETENDTWRSNVVQQEMDYLDGITSDIQTQLDARCLESVFGTAIGTGLLLDTTTLKASAVLQKYHAIDPSTDIQTYLGAANYAAMMALLSGTAGADFAMNTHKITGVVDPTAAQEAATKKYVDDNAGVGDVTIAMLSPIAIPAGHFMPTYDTDDWTRDATGLRNRSTLNLQHFYTPIYFPDGVTVSKLTLYGYRNDADAIMYLYLYRLDHTSTSTAMANVIADWTSGNSSGYDDSISNATIDNDTYSYYLRVDLDPNDNVADVKFISAEVAFS